MPVGEAAFLTSVFSVDIAGVAPHPNPVTCVVMGRRGPLTVIGDVSKVVGDILIIRPGVEHRILCPPGGMSAMYLDGTPWSGGDVVAQRLDGRLGHLAQAGIALDGGAQRELRERLGQRTDQLRRNVRSILEGLIAEPMIRMSQTELARRLDLERTQALRMFKSVTGMTFRQYKRWIGLQHAAHRIASGELVRTAALDAGFADTAHLTRTFRHSFGLTPSEAIAGLPRIGGF